MHGEALCPPCFRRVADVIGMVVTQMAPLAERLDATGDANDVAGTQAAYEKLMKVLDGLRENSSMGKAK